jgi:2-amino-4-hydroxy-6-hydroxymethyldihydropteridine diphosphokinase
LGRAVYAADFLEPGRRERMEWRETLRTRMLVEPDAVVREVARMRIGRLLDLAAPIRPETCDFWNTLTRNG